LQSWETFLRRDAISRQPLAGEECRQSAVGRILPDPTASQAILRWPQYRFPAQVNSSRRWRKRPAENGRALQPLVVVPLAGFDQGTVSQGFVALSALTAV